MTTLAFDILARDRASAVFDKVGAKAGSVDGKLGKIGKTAAVVAGVVVGVGVTAFNLAASFDDAFDRIRVGTGATGTKLQGLQDTFRNVVRSVPTDFDTASKAITDLSRRTGLAGPPLQKLATQFLELSRLTETDVTTNIRSVTRLFGDWSISTDKQAGALDLLFRASQVTGSGISSLTDTVVQFGAPLRQLGFTFEESIALLGKWEQEGVNIETVLAGMKKGLAGFAKAGKDPAQALAEITEKIKGAGSAAEANKLAIATFGARAGPDMAAAIREGRFEIGALFKQMRDGKDTIAAASEQTRDFAEKWEILKNKVAVAIEPALAKLFDTVSQAVDKIGPVVQWLKDKFGPQLDFIGTQLKKLGGPAIKAFAVGIVAAFVMIAAAALVLGLAIAGIVVAVEKTVAAVKVAWDKTAAFLNFTWGFISARAKAIWEGIKTAVLTPVTAISAGIQAAWALIQRITQAVWDFIKNAIINPIRAALGVVTGTVGAIVGAFNTFAQIPAMVGRFMGSMVSGFVGALGTVKGVAQSAVNSIVGIFSATAGRLEPAGRSIMQGVNRGMQSQMSLLARTASRASQIIRENKGPLTKDKVMLIPHGKAIMGGLLVGLRRGFSPVQSALTAMTGQISSDVGVQVTHGFTAPTAPTPMAQAVGVSAAVTPITIQFSGPVGSPTELRDWLARALDDLKRANRLVT